MPTVILALTVHATLTWYDPALCQSEPTNCYNPATPFRMAAGNDAREWYGRALACPPEFPLFTEFIVTGSRFGLADGRFVCMDRGGAVIVKKDGTVVLDLLRSTPVWNERIPVTVLLPDSSCDIITVLREAGAFLFADRQPLLYECPDSLSKGPANVRQWLSDSYDEAMHEMQEGQAAFRIQQRSVQNGWARTEVQGLSGVSGDQERRPSARSEALFTLSASKACFRIQARQAQFERAHCGL